jgi:hypothetical protein
MDKVHEQNDSDSYFVHKKIYSILSAICLLFYRIWLKSNVSEALRKLAACQPVREEIVRLQKGLCDTLGVQSVVWDCGWNVTHFRGCLLSFQALARHHPSIMHTLKGEGYQCWCQCV